MLGSSPNYGYLNSTDTFDSVSKVISHSVLLTGLSAGQTYYYRVISLASPTALSEEGTFRTLSVAGAPPAESNFVLGSVAFVADKFPIEIDVPSEEKILSEVLGEELIPTKTFFMKNLGWFITLFCSSTGLLIIQLRRLLRLIAKRKTLTGKHENQIRRTTRAKPQRKRRHN